MASSTLAAGSAICLRHSPTLAGPRCKRVQRGNAEVLEISHVALYGDAAALRFTVTRPSLPICIDAPSFALWLASALAGRDDAAEAAADRLPEMRRRSRVGEEAARRVSLRVRSGRKPRRDGASRPEAASLQAAGPVANPNKKGTNSCQATSGDL